MPETTYYAIKNWAKYQHYKDRRPPWIKYYVTFNEDTQHLTNDARLVAALLFCIAANKDNRIPNDVAWIAAETGISKAIIRRSLAELEADDWFETASNPASARASKRASKTASSNASAPASETARPSARTHSREHAPAPPPSQEEETETERAREAVTATGSVVRETAANGSGPGHGEPPAVEKIDFDSILKEL